MQHYLYLFLNIATLLFPLLWSFEGKISFARKWPALLPAIGVTALFFLIWDHQFTEMEVWGFNPQFLTGIYLWNLPLEECLFFFTVPYSCLFIYEVLDYYLKKDYFRSFSYRLAIIIAIFLLVFGLVSVHRWYTMVCFLTVGMMLLCHVYYFKDKLIGKFLLFYLIHLIPFLLFNGTLTGAFTASPVVFYDDSENLGLRIITIPIEDFIYSMGMMLMNVSLYKVFAHRKTISLSNG